MNNHLICVDQSFSTHWRLGLLTAVGALLFLQLAACSENETGMAGQAMPAPMASAARMEAAPAPAQAASADSPSAGDASPEQQRFIATRHALQVEVSSDRMAGAWKAVSDQCAQLDCVVLESALRRDSPNQAAGAELELRVAPKDVPALLGSVEGAGRVTSHATTSEDKTAQVVDVQAHIKNRTEFRDSLRALLAAGTANRKLADVLDIQRTLSDTQAELDSYATQLKLLQQETLRQTVRIDFQPERSVVGRNVANPVWEAFGQAGDVMSNSLATVITVVAALLPWLLVALPVFWVLAGLLRRWRKRRAVAHMARTTQANA